MLAGTVARSIEIVSLPLPASTEMVLMPAPGQFTLRESTTTQVPLAVISEVASKTR